MCRSKSKQQMDVIGNAAHRFGNNFKRLCRATEIGMKARTPFGCNKRALMFGAENDVEVQTEVG